MPDGEGDDGRDQMIDIDGALAKLMGYGFFEAYYVTTFRCHRKTKSGGAQGVTVEIYDSGTQEGSTSRYRCLARSDDGKEASGKAASSINTALLMVHWQDLD
jgi:hypothetical protein